MRTLAGLATWLLLLAAGCSRAPQPAAAAPCEHDDPGAPSPGSAAAGAAEQLKAIMASRRSVRQHGDRAISRESLDELLWAAGGITQPEEAAGREGVTGLRAAPSAGARYPLELFALVERVEGLSPGLYHYGPEGDELSPAGPSGPLGAELARVALGQRSIATAAATVILAADVSRSAARYGSRARRYVHMEVGHAAQNVLLAATARGLAACPVGAFDDADVAELLELSPPLEVLYLIPVGAPL